MPHGDWDGQEKFAWAKLQNAETVRLRGALEAARRLLGQLTSEVECRPRPDLPGMHEVPPHVIARSNSDLDSCAQAARAFLATTPVPPGARGLGTSALIQGATREPFIAARGASGSSTGPGSPKQGFFTPAQRLLPCLDCGKASGANSEHDWHHPFNPGVERGVPGPGEGSK